MNSRQIQEILKAVTGGQIQQILAVVLAIITAVGGVATVGSSNGGISGGGGTNISTPGNDDQGNPVPVTREKVLLSTVSDSGGAVKGKVTAGGKQYQNGWLFDGFDNQHFQTNNEYHTLTATIQIADGNTEVQPRIVVNGYEYNLNKDNPSRTITVSVKDQNNVTIRSRGGKIAFYNAYLHK